MSMCISEDRMQDKLAWVTEYTEDIAMWQECQHVVSKCVTFINEQYLFKGASQAMKAEIGDSLQYDKSTNPKQLRKLTRPVSHPVDLPTVSM